jgi:hypothetical protein
MFDFFVMITAIMFVPSVIAAYNLGRRRDSHERFEAVKRDN